jgi:deferrochelatase/peroxidase EfeB
MRPETDIGDTEALARMQGHVFKHVRDSETAAHHQRSQFLFVDHHDPERIRWILHELFKRKLTANASSVDATKPNVAVGFTHAALHNLGVGYRPLRVQANRSGSRARDDAVEDDPFQAGMPARAKQLGDPPDLEWKGQDHGLLLWISDCPEPDGTPGSQLDACNLAKALKLEKNDFQVEQGHWWLPSEIDPDANDQSRLLLGHIDGSSNPYVTELASKNGGPTLAGGGTVQPEGWRPVPLGEFALGRPDAADGQEAPGPRWLTLDGTFLVYRKYHVYGDRYQKFLEEAALEFETQTDEAVAPADIAAKVMGRYQVASRPDDREDRNGAESGKVYDSVLNVSPGTSGASWTTTEPEGPNDFRYDVDTAGFLCPLGAHMRRSNPRDALGFDGELVERHRIIRRGSFRSIEEVPGGQELHFVALNARIADGFEFIQRQWLNTGQRFRLGRDPDIIVGARRHGHLKNDEVQMVIQGNRPAIVTSTEPIAELMGGDYFLVPGWAGLRRLAGLDDDGD